MSHCGRPQNHNFKTYYWVSRVGFIVELMFLSACFCFPFMCFFQSLNIKDHLQKYYKKPFCRMSVTYLFFENTAFKRYETLDIWLKNYQMTNYFQQERTTSALQFSMVRNVRESQLLETNFPRHRKFSHVLWRNTTYCIHFIISMCYQCRESALLNFCDYFYHLLMYLNFNINHVIYLSNTQIFYYSITMNITNCQHKTSLSLVLNF